MKQPLTEEEKARLLKIVEELDPEDCALSGVKDQKAETAFLYETDLFQSGIVVAALLLSDTKLARAVGVSIMSTGFAAGYEAAKRMSLPKEEQ